MNKKMRRVLRKPTPAEVAAMNLETERFAAEVARWSDFQLTARMVAGLREMAERDGLEATAAFAMHWAERMIEALGQDVDPRPRGRA